MINHKINKIPIGDDNPAFITFEIGPTHNGVESAKRLIKHSVNAGANAVKFQIFDPDRLVSDRKQLFSYEVLLDRATNKRRTIEEPLYDILKRRFLPFEQWQEIKRYCDELNIAFFATVGFEEDINLLERLNCHSIKIASADINHLPLIRRAAQTGMSIQIDTGMSTMGEVEQAINVINQEGNQNIIIHQCPSGYPAYLESINLKIIPTLKQVFGYPVAFSDHSPGWDMDIAAIALGANLIEKTVTEDRTTPSVEHVMSIEPCEMSLFIKSIKEIETALGSGLSRKMNAKESHKRDMIRRSLFAKNDIRAGTSLKDSSVEFRRPGNGMSPTLYEQLVSQDSIVKSNIKAGNQIQFSDIG